MTHLFKALRNQLLASQPSGSNAFLDLDKHSTPFGWAFILKLNHLLKEEAKNANGQFKRNIHLKDKSANPTSYRKMEVSLAKIIAEHKTPCFAEEIIYQALGITTEDLEHAVQAPRAILRFG